MKARRLTGIAVVLAAAQMLLAGGLWWVLSESPGVVDSRRGPAPTMATQRLAELYANAAFRAVITSDYAALNELIRRSTAWSEVAYVSVEDAQGKILANTDPAKVGRTWSAKLSDETRAAVRMPYEEVTAPLSDGTGKSTARAGQLRLGYAAAGAGSPGGGPSFPVPLSLVLAVAAVAAIPVAVVIETILRRGSDDLRVLRELPAISLSREQKLAEQLRDARAEVQRVRADLTQSAQDAAKIQSERDMHREEADLRRAEIEDMRTSLDHYMGELQKLRADAALMEAGLASTQVEAPAGAGTPGVAALPAQCETDVKRIQAQTMAHIAQAFRSSLTNILGYSKLLIRGVDGELSAAQKANVVNILESGTRLVALVNGLSDYVRLEAGTGAAASVTVVDLGAVLSHVAAESPSDDRRLVTEPFTDPVEVTADPRQLEQIVRSMATDAMALDPQAVGRLSVTPGDGRVVVELLLTDFHAAPEDLLHLLDPLAGDGHSRPLDEGRLRLALARSFARANGGEFRLDVRGPAEVAFVLELPAASAPVVS